MLRNHLFLVVGLLLAFQATAQAPTSVERNSKLNLELKRSSKKSSSLVLQAGDILSIDARAEGKVNIKISDPDGQVIFQDIISSKRLEWQNTLNTGGSYTVEMENPDLVFKARVSLTLSVLRNDFTYGDPSMDTLISSRNRKVFIDGEFQIARNAPKSYNYSAQQGDTLILAFKPLSSNLPAIEIQNNFNELVYAAFPSKKEQFAEIPVLATGAYTVTMNSDAFIPKNNRLKVERISPARYAALPEEVAEEAPVEEVATPLYDTIPETYMDTIIFLGAQRDIINPSRRSLQFQFDDPSTIFKWIVFFGSGEGFMKEVSALSPMLEGEAMAAGATNILAAYGLGLLKTLPKSSEELVRFTPSPSIRSQIKNSLQNNHATMNSGYGNYSLMMENKSQSAGQQVQVQVVVFRKIKLEN